MMELSPMLDKESEVPIYKQLYAYIRHEIEAGKLRENDRLPSIRQLSSNLILSKNTVDAAYQQLLAEGYVQSKPRSGIRVLLQEQLIAGSDVALGSNLERVAVLDRDAVVVGQLPINPGGRALIDFKYGNIELEKFPLTTWNKCLMHGINGGEPLYDVLGYGDPQGDGNLRLEIAKHLYPSRGVVCSPHQVFLCSGTQQAIGLICQLLPLTKRVAMENPGYDGVRELLANHGRDIVPIPLEADGLDIEFMRRQDVQAVYVTPSHQFPLGSVLPIQKRSKLLQWACDTDGLIIEDDYDSEFRYQAQPIPSLKAMDDQGRVIYIGTFSKSFLPAVRISYIVMPDRLAKDFCDRLAHYSQSTSPILQKAMHRFMKEGHYERHVRRMRKLYQAKHRTLLRAIHQHMGDRVEVIGQKAGLHLLLDVRNRQGEELLRLALKHEVKIYLPNNHWMNPTQCPVSYVMLGFGGLNESSIEEGVKRLKEAWFDHL